MPDRRSESSTDSSQQCHDGLATSSMNYPSSYTQLSLCGLHSNGCRWMLVAVLNVLYAPQGNEQKVADPVNTEGMGPQGGKEGDSTRGKLVGTSTQDPKLI